MKTISIIIVLIIGFAFNANSQCNEALVDSAIKNAGTDVIYLRDFRIKNTKKKHPGIVNAAYDIRMNTGSTYRFNVFNAKEYAGEAVINLYNKNLLLASTFNSETKSNSSVFEFLCTETNDYQVVLSFNKNEKGCAVAVLSLVVNDSLINTGDDYLTENENVLYVGIDNFVDIGISKEKDENAIVSVSNGTITEDGGLYKVIVEKEGPVKISIEITDAQGNVKQTISSNFIAKRLPPPVAKFAGRSGGLIFTEDIINTSNLLEIEDQYTDEKYKVKEFTVAKQLYGGGIKASNSNSLSYSQISFIKTAKSGETIYIKNIIVENSSKKILKLEPLVFIIEK